MINILLSTYNGEKYIEEQLDSIRNQTYQDFHLYIRDDGSRDHTVDVVRRYIEQYAMDHYCTLVAGENVGFALSFRELLEMSQSGEYWAFCDQDDDWMPEKLQHAIEWLDTQEKSRPAFFHSGVAIGNEDLSEQYMYTIPYHVGAYRFQFMNMFASNVFFGFAMVINKALYTELIRADFRKVKYHDWFAAMIAETFGAWKVGECVDVVHRQHKQNASPFYFMKKIPDGLKLLRGDNFYTRNAREFKRLYTSKEIEDASFSMTKEQASICDWFVNERYSLGTGMKKMFYPHRWNPQLKVECVLRILMLIGKI